MTTLTIYFLKVLLTISENKMLPIVTLNKVLHDIDVKMRKIGPHIAQRADEERSSLSFFIAKIESVNGEVQVTDFKWSVSAVIIGLRPEHLGSYCLFSRFKAFKLEKSFHRNQLRSKKRKLNIILDRDPVLKGTFYLEMHMSSIEVLLPGNKTFLKKKYATTKKTSRISMSSLYAYERQLSFDSENDIGIYHVRLVISRTLFICIIVTHKVKILFENTDRVSKNPAHLKFKAQCLQLVHSFIIIPCHFSSLNWYLNHSQ